jgi:DHA2 family metal-tetracycline-proton antiporter-like MFS transporter
MSENHSQSANMQRLVPWIIYIIFFAVLNETVFNVSTPNIASQFHLNPSQVSWIITIFIIFFGMGSVIYGKLSDAFSVKKLISFGILLYSSSSIVGFIFHDNYPIVIVARALQGAGASAIPALVMIIIARYFSKEQRGKLFGIITSTVSFAIGVGPVLGGYVSGTYHWSYLFVIPVFSLVALPFIQRILPSEETSNARLDILGTILMGVSVSSLILYLTESDLFYIPIFILALLGFIIHIRRVQNPFVEPELFRNRYYRNALVIGFLIFSTVMAVMFILPLMLHDLYQLSTQTIGLIMFPGAFSAVIFGTVAGNLTVRKGSHFVVYLGLGLIAVSLFLQASVVGIWVWYIGIALVVQYVGFSFLQTALIESVTNILPNKQIGVGMGFYNLITFVSGAVGTALVSKAMEQPVFKIAVHPLIQNPNAYAFSNFMLIFTVVVIASALLYFFTFGKQANLTEESAQ